jgi:hypothetical protein
MIDECRVGIVGRPVFNFLPKKVARLEKSVLV